MLNWRKSSWSSAGDNCVEVAGTVTGDILVRNSKRPDGEVVSFTRSELKAFVNGVKDGEFDDLC